jgi:hypothetical protein
VAKIFKNYTQAPQKFLSTMVSSMVSAMVSAMLISMEKIIFMPYHLCITQLRFQDAIISIRDYNVFIPYVVVFSVFMEFFCRV